MLSNIIGCILQISCAGVVDHRCVMALHTRLQNCPCYTHAEDRLIWFSPRVHLILRSRFNSKLSFYQQWAELQLICAPGGRGQCSIKRNEQYHVLKGWFPITTNLSDLMLFSCITASMDGKQTCISANRRSEMSVKRSCKPVMVILRKGQISAAKINGLCVATGESYMDSLESVN